MQLKTGKLVLDALGACQSIEAHAKLDPEVANRIPELRQVVDFRNRIIHGCDAIDDEIVWKTIQTDVPPLRTRRAALLNSPDEGAK